MYIDESPASAVHSEMDYLDVKNLAQTGEGTFLEFKRTVPGAQKIAREIAAFANTHGGTLLVGVNDDGSLVGVDGYKEEEFILKKASNKVCRPAVEIQLEIVPFGKHDLLVIHIPEAEEKPIYVTAQDDSLVYIRENDRSKHISYEQIKILEFKYSDQPINFEFGADEQKLFRYLNEYGEISVTKFMHLIDKDRENAADILVNLVNADILRLFTKDKIDYFTFSK